MWIDTLILKNIRAIPDATLHFSRGINILVGKNNAGKSTVLLPLLSLQNELRTLDREDTRLGTTEALAEIVFAEPDPKLIKKQYDQICFRPHGNNLVLQGKAQNKEWVGIERFPNYEPKNFIYPFVSNRKAVTLTETVNSETAIKVASNFVNLNAKIDRLANPEFLPAHELYMRACRDILGFCITSTHTNQGKRAVYTVRNLDSIPLHAMGEGVMNVLGLVAHLALAENKLFLVEEPENDIHPKALKALMDLIIESSVKNQFIITTHSNIVLKRLGAADNSRIFNVSCELIDRLPTSTVTQVEDTTEARHAVLQDLGYEMSDSDLWDAWLLLEESSAERLVRQYFIPWYATRMQGRLRTVAAHSISEIPIKFANFNNLFVFLHRASVYTNRAWVVVDGGPNEESVIDKLRATYAPSGWKADQFMLFKEHDFERYLPKQFQDEVTYTLNIADKKAKREAKKVLLEKVLAWVAEDEERAKAEFANSAAEVIAILKIIETAIRQEK